MILGVAPVGASPPFPAINQSIPEEKKDINFFVKFNIRQLREREREFICISSLKTLFDKIHTPTLEKERKTKRLIYTYMH